MPTATATTPCPALDHPPTSAFSLLASPFIGKRNMLQPSAWGSTDAALYGPA